MKPSLNYYKDKHRYINMQIDTLTYENAACVDWSAEQLRTIPHRVLHDRSGLRTVQFRSCKAATQFCALMQDFGLRFGLKMSEYKPFLSNHTIKSANTKLHGIAWI